MVASACDTQTNTKVAIKRVHKVLKPQSDARGAIEAKRMLREILLLRAMDHPNIINVMHMWYNGKDVYLVRSSSGLVGSGRLLVTGGAADGSRSAQSNQISTKAD